MSWCRLCSVNSLFDKSKNPSFSTGVLEFMTWQADVDLLRFTFSADIERKHNLAVKQKNEKAVIQTKFLEIRSENNQMEEQLKKTEKDKQLLAARVDDLEIRIENSERQTAAAIAECEQLRCQLSEAKSLEASQAEILKIKEDDIVTLQAEVEVWYICSEIFLAFFPLKTGFLHVQRALYTSRLQIL
jgi:septal ring factor EnvC (AmiA/AmiB activator)